MVTKVFGVLVGGEVFLRVEVVLLGVVFPEPKLVDVCLHSLVYLLVGLDVVDTGISFGEDGINIF